MANSADPDQLASSETNWSGYTLFAKEGHIWFSRTKVKISADDILKIFTLFFWEIWDFVLYKVSPYKLLIPNFCDKIPNFINMIFLPL